MIVARGARENPLGEADLRRKFVALAEPSLGAAAGRVWSLFDHPGDACVLGVVELLQPPGNGGR